MDVIDNSHMEQVITYLAQHPLTEFKAGKHGTRGWILALRKENEPDRVFTGHTFAEAIRKTSEWVFTQYQQLN